MNKLKERMIKTFSASMFLCFFCSGLHGEYFPEVVISVPQTECLEGMPIPIDLTLRNLSDKPVMVTDAFLKFGPYRIQVFEDSQWKEIQDQYFYNYYPNYNVNYETQVDPGEILNMRSYITLRYKQFPCGEYKLRAEYGIASYEATITVKQNNEEMILREIASLKKEIFEKGNDVKTGELVKKLLAFTNPKAIPVILECFSFLYKYGPASYDKDFFFSLRAFNTLEGDLALIENTPAGLEVNCSHWLEDRSRDRIMQLIEGSKNLTDESHKLIVDLLRKRLETMK